ncbi:hypothetical protein ACCD07_23340, partial [Duganella sp. Dugasp56]
MTQAQAAPTIPGKARYLIHAPGGAPLTDFLALADVDPEITVVDVIGPRDSPHTAVVEISPDKARGGGGGGGGRPPPPPPPGGWKTPPPPGGGGARPAP